MKSNKSISQILSNGLRLKQKSYTNLLHNDISMENTNISKLFTQNAEYDYYSLFCCRVSLLRTQGACDEI